jgi:type IV pilus assembly protein PilW
VVAGAAPGVLPVAATAAVATADDGITVTNTSGFVAGSVAAISDCLKSSVFVARTVTAATGQIAHTAGGVGIANTVDTLPVAYAAGAQVVPLQQTAFFVSFDQTSGSSVLVRAIYAGGLWNVQSLVPGIETMQVLYGIGTNGAITQYVPAGAVTDWTSVYSVRLAFLLEGDTGSAGTGQGAASIPPLLGTAVIAPVDTRQRHVFEMTVNLRNAAP